MEKGELLPSDCRAFCQRSVKAERELQKEVMRAYSLEMCGKCSVG